MKVNCTVCDLEIDVKPSRLERIKSALTCSVTCRNEHFKTYYQGENNPNAKYAGKTPLEIFFKDKESKLRHTATQRGIAFEITSADLLSLYNDQNGLCFYTGVPMALFTTPDWKNKRQASPDILSVDRKDSSKGYSIGNVVLCCNAINKMKGSSDIKEIQPLFNYIVSKYMDTCHIRVKKVRENAQKPNKARLGDAGYDLAVAEFEDLGDKIKVYTGIAVQPTPGWFCEVYPRSSLHKKGLMLYNSVGIIDNAYTGEIIVMLYKTNDKASVEVGERVAQLIPKRYAMVEFEEVDDLDDTQRGVGGFGSTGTN